MNKTISILTLILILTACGSENNSSNSADTSSTSSSNNQSVKEPGKILACSYLTKNFVEENFAGSNITYYEEADIKYTSLCTAIFDYNDTHHKISLTIHSIGKGTDKLLERSISHFKEKAMAEEISGIGEKAYTRPDKWGFIMALNNKNLIQVSVGKGDRDEFNFELSKKITIAMFAKLDK